MPRKLERNVLTGSWGRVRVPIRKSELLSSRPTCDFFLISFPPQDPFGEKRGHFDYQSLLMRLGLIRQKVLERLHNENAEMDSDSSSSGTETDLHGSLRV